jgi:hypothetical protein
MASPGAAFSAVLVAEDFPWVRRSRGSTHDLLKPCEIFVSTESIAAALQVEREEEMGMAPDTYREVFDLAQRGTRAFRERRFDEVIVRPAPFRITAMSVRLGCVPVYPEWNLASSSWIMASASEFLIGICFINRGRMGVGLGSSMSCW